MKLKFDTEVDGSEAATALIALLTSLYPVKPASLAETLKDHASPEALAAIVADSPASDGYPAEEPDAAEAFGAVPPSDEGRDSAGIPWDERIHSSTKGTNKDGTWSRRRNTPDATFDAVMAELRGNAAAKPATPPSPDTTAPETGPTATVAASPTDLPPPPPPPPAPASGPVTFPLLMMKITKAQGAGKITKDKVTEFLGGLGLATMPDLIKATPDTLAAMNAMVDDHVGV